VKSKVELAAIVKGIDPKDQMRQGDLVSFTVTVRAPDGAPADACCANRLHWIVLTNDLSREVHFHEFKPTLRVMTADF